MSEKFKREMIGIGGGLAAVELGPEAVNATVKEVSQEMGANFNFSAAEASELGKITHNVVEVGQEVAIPLGVALVVYAGLKEMFRGFEKKKQSKVSR